MILFGAAYVDRMQKQRVCHRSLLGKIANPFYRQRHGAGLVRIHLNGKASDMEGDRLPHIGSNLDRGCERQCSAILCSSLKIEKHLNVFLSGGLD